MKNSSKALKMAVNIVLWVIIVLAAVFSILTFATKSEAGVASIGGYIPMTVMSDSMVPVFQQGDLIIVKEVDPSVIEKGDVVSFWTIIENRRAINTHRVEEVLQNGDVLQFVTKGDANELVDTSLVSSADIIGEYDFRVPVVGKILQVLSSSIGFLLIIVVPLLIFFLYQLYKLILIVIEMKKQAVHEAEDEVRAKLEEETRAKLEEEIRRKIAEEAAAEKAAAEASKAEEEKAEN